MSSLILASLSPRRRDILTMAGVPFSIVPPTFDEHSLDETLPPHEHAVLLSAGKARSVRGGRELNTIIAADTIVAIGGLILGKPQDADEARDMLLTLSGRTHQVYTGVCILSPHGEYTFFEKTAVGFYRLTSRDIRDYIATGEPFDKAGGYGIQGPGALFVRRLSGDYYNVMGLPVARLMRELRRIEKENR